MFKRSIRTLTIATAVGVAAIASAASAAAVAVGPQQYFTGSVNTHTDSAVIDVLCAGAASFGHPLPNQTVGIRLLLPPAATTAGYTGLSATSIDAWLSWPSPTVLPPPAAIAKFANYTSAPIPTNITVPCSGSGVVTFVPNPDDGGRPTSVQVSFVNLGA